MKNKMFDLLNQGLTEAIEFEQGKRTLKSREVILPQAPKVYTSEDVKALRVELDCSQPLLAAMLNVSPKTVQAWEAGTRRPNSIANRLMNIIESEKHRSIFFQAVQTCRQKRI